ncbi:MAG: hypothetical protein ACHQ15_03555 [Candidatus Limnocylindrales bacterium]
MSNEPPVEGPVQSDRPAAERPLYKGAPLDPARGPGLGCFWAQIVVLVALLVITPFGVVNAWPSWLTTALLGAILVLTLFAGQTVIFLLRLVAADRRARRRPMRGDATRTVGDLSTQTMDERGEER